jgi:hypothetical protein
MEDTDNQYDGILLKMIEDSKGYEGFFDLIFSALRRKTDFFSHKNVAEKIIAETGKKHIIQYMEDQEKEKKKEETKKSRRRDRQKEIEKKRQQAEEELKRQREAEAQKEETLEEKNKNKPEFKVTGKPKPNDRNGGDNDQYSWGQSLEQVDITVFIGENIKAKQLDVKITSTSVRIAKKDGSKVYLEGEWAEKIDSEESFWTLETTKNGKDLSMNITKMPNQDKWWDNIIKGHQKIDTSKVNPEPSKLSDLDGEMRGEVEKMMFDMRQKQMGKPSSDELKKREMLEKVMKANPNLKFDLSNAKFS